MQNPFTKGAQREKTLTTELTTLNIRYTDLDRQIADAQASIAARRSEHTELHIEGTNAAAISKAGEALAAAERDLAGKLAAFAKIETLISGKEAELAGIVDQKARKATVETLEAQARRFHQAHDTLLGALTDFAKAAGDIGPIIPEAAQLSVFAESLANIDLPPAAKGVATQIASYVVAVQNGTAPAGLPKAEATPTPVSAPPAPVTTRLFTLKPVRWREPSNPVIERYRAQYAPLDLPPHLAEMAIAANLALPISDRRVADLSRRHAPKEVAPESCIWIDGSEQQDKAAVIDGERILHSAFDH